MAAEARHILLVDADGGQARLKDALRTAGFQLLIAESVQEAKTWLTRAGADLVLLERDLPDMDGLDFCRFLRGTERFRTLPVVFLAERAEAEDRVVGLEAGADDYVSKACIPRELLLRVRALLKPTPTATVPEGGRMEIGCLMIDPLGYEVRVSGRRICVTETEFRLLLALASPPGRVKSRMELLANLWPEDHAERSPRSVDTHIRRLRAKLGPAREHLKTIKGFGYRLAA